MSRRRAIRWFSLASLLLALLVPQLPAAEEAAGKAPAAELKLEQTTQDPAEKKLHDDEYYELLRVFADTLDQVDRNYVKDISRRELLEAAIQGMLTKLDQYSDYIPPKELDQFRRGVESEFGGIGIQVSIDEDGFLKIISPLVGSPAYRAGLMAGDRIVAIEGQTTEGITLDEAIRRMKGKVGTDVEVTVKHAQGKTETVKLRREIVRLETVMGYRRNPDNSWDFMADDAQKIGYVRLTAFSRHTSEELRDALQKLSAQGAKALVLDLRFNPGGLLSSAIEISDMFITDGLIVSTEGRNIPPRSWYAEKEGTFADLPMVVLVNRFSASASEIVSACLKDHGRAVVIGERTWGKGSVQNIIELEDGKSALKLTTAGYKRPNGKNIHRFEGAEESDEWGVTPDDGLEMKLSIAEMRQLHLLLQQRDRLVSSAEQSEQPDPNSKDRQLEKAVSLLTDKLNGGTQKAEAPAEASKSAADAAAQ